MSQDPLEARAFQARNPDSLGILVAGFAHDINHALAIAMGTASLRAQLAQDPADLEAYQIIGRACERGREAVKSLIQLAQPALPAHACAAPPEPFGEGSSPRRALGAMTVVLVDDDEDVRFLMTRMLKKAGVRQVKTYPGGEAALAALRAEDLPDLIILDQNMPGLDGIQTMARIRARHPDLPILISSGQPDVEAWDCFKRPGASVIAKPFTLDELQSRLAQIAGRAHPGEPGS